MYSIINAYIEELLLIVLMHVMLNMNLLQMLVCMCLTVTGAPAAPASGSVCLGVKGTSTTGHRLSQTGWARDVLTSPHALPVHSYSSSFLLKSGLYTHIHIQYSCTYAQQYFLNLRPGCGGFDPYSA